MIVTTTHFIEILPQEGKQLYNEQLQITTNRVTTPLDADISDWVEVEIQEDQQTTL